MCVSKDFKADSLEVSGSRLCCSSFVQKYYDNLINSESDYDDKVDCSVEHFYETTILSSLKRWIKEKWLNLCDDFFLAFGDLMPALDDDHDHFRAANSKIESEADVHAAVETRDDMDILEGGAGFHAQPSEMTILSQVLIDSASKAAAQWRPQKRHIIGRPFISDLEVSIIVICFCLLDGAQNNIQNNHLHDHCTGYSSKLLKQELVVSNHSGGDDTVTVKRMPGITIKGLSKFQKMAQCAWGAKNYFVFNQLYVWRERTAAVYDRPAQFVCPNYLMFEVAAALPSTVGQVLTLQFPLPGLLAGQVEFFDVEKSERMVPGKI